MVARLDGGTYTVPLTEAFKSCRMRLPWWRSDAMSHVHALNRSKAVPVTA